MKKNIQILMSTYNGEKYIKEQLDSIILQKGNFDLKLLIRDDGSSDETIKIIKEYSEKIEMKVIEGENIGVNKSLEELFKKCDTGCDYFAISDQDDVWLEGKLENAINKLNQMNSKFKLFASRSFVTDENLNIFGKTQDSEGRNSFYNSMVQNICPGHTQVFSREIVLELQKNYSRDIFIIDWWIYLLASGIGEVFFYREFTVKHRQHRLNAAGYEVSFLKKINRRLKYLRKYKESPVSKQIRAFYNIYKGKMKLEYEQEIERFLGNQKNVFLRIKYILNCKTFRYGKIENSIYKILYVFGKYKL